MLVSIFPKSLYNYVPTNLDITKDVGWWFKIKYKLLNYNLMYHRDDERVANIFKFDIFVVVYYDTEDT